MRTLRPRSSPPVPAHPRVSIFGPRLDAPADLPPDAAAGRYLGIVGSVHPAASDAALGSRRHKLWDLPAATLCPLIGVCLPLATLRRLLSKLAHEPLQTDYEVHCAAIAACSQRSPLCEAIQRELDRRHAVVLQRFARAKTAEAVADLWRSDCAGSDPAGALWAGLTHPRCDDLLREAILCDIHMLQHQRGAGQRADLRQLQVLGDELAGLRRELAATRERHARTTAEQQAGVEALGAELRQWRAAASDKDRQIGALTRALEDATTTDADAELQHLRLRNAELRRELADTRRAARRDERRLDRALAGPRPGDDAQWTGHDRHAEVAPVSAPGSPEAAPRHLHLLDTCVLCVGGRTASVPVYRRLTEVNGGRFAHHDGGAEQSATRLESNLAAADLVICQTGCISHDAYWRVKDHCKRTGKRCVFVDNPSAASFARGLRAAPAALAE